MPLEEKSYNVHDWFIKWIITQVKVSAVPLFEDPDVFIYTDVEIIVHQYDKPH